MTSLRRSRPVLAAIAVGFLVAGYGKAKSNAPSLITTDQLADLITAKSVTILDVRQAWTDYLSNHLPGAGWLHVETLRVSRDGLPFQLLPSEQYSVIFGRLGVEIGRPVVIYSAGSANDIDATFVAWLLEAFGHHSVYVLDGGYAKWELEGRPLTQKYPDARSAGFPAQPFKPEVATLDDVRRAVSQKDALIVDARPPEQYTGQAGAQPRRGHIPGAVNHPWKSDLETRDLALVWKPVDALREGYEGQGITSDRSIIVYCNTGTEASHVFFALRYLLGYSKVRIYTGSWSQWSEREELPIEGQ